MIDILAFALAIMAYGTIAVMASRATRRHRIVIRCYCGRRATSVVCLTSQDVDQMRRLLSEGCESCRQRRLDVYA